MTIETDNKVYEFDLRVQKEIYYSEDSNWGIYAFVLNNPSDKKRFYNSVKVHDDFGTIAIKGNMPKMEFGDSYIFRFTDTYDDKYGHGYQLIEIRSNGTISASEQKAYIRYKLTEKRAEGIIAAFGNEDNLIEGIIDGTHDITYVKGITENNKDKIIDSLRDYETAAEVYVALSALNIGVTTANNIIEHFGGAIQTLQVINNNIYRLTEVHRLGFKIVDIFAQNAGYRLDDPERIKYGAIYVLKELTQQGDTKISVDTFEEKLKDILKIDEVSDEIFDTIVNNEEVYFEQGIISLQALYEEERFVAREFVNFQQKVTPINGNLDLADEIIKQHEEQNGFKFVSEQIEAIKSPLTNGVTIITGSAGTGKSKTVATIVDILQAYGLETMGVALSGKAANVLVENGVRNASTIHRGFKLPIGEIKPITMRQEEQNPEDRLRMDKGSFSKDSTKEERRKFYEEPQYVHAQAVVIDEASMNNTSLFAAMMYFMRHGTRLIIIGDDAQLPPIGHGNVFATLLKSELPTIRLTKIHRQAAQSGIITYANKVRHHQPIVHHHSYGAHVLGELKDFHLFNLQDKSVIQGAIRQTVERFLQNPDEDFDNLQIISPVKRGECGTNKLNDMVQSIVNPIDEKRDHLVPLHNGNQLKKGDRVINSGNLILSAKYFGVSEEDEMDELEMSGKARVYNGTIGKVADITYNRANKHNTVYVSYLLEGREVVVCYEQEHVKHLELAYAITCHRSQGSGFHTVIFVADYSAFVLLSKELVYTGMTRAVKRLLMFAEASALKYSINKSHGGQRINFLPEMLSEEWNKRNN